MDLFPGKKTSPPLFFLEKRKMFFPFVSGVFFSLVKFKHGGIPSDLHVSLFSRSLRSFFHESSERIFIDRVDTPRRAHVAEFCDLIFFSPHVILMTF